MIELNLTSLIQLMNFIFLMFVLRKLLYSKFFDIIDERKRAVESEIEEAEKIRIDAESYRKKHREEMESAQEKADQIIRKAEQKAEKIISEAKENADSQARKTLEDARVQVDREREEAMEELRTSVVTAAVELVGRFLGRELDERARKQYFQRISRQMDDNS